GGQSIGAQASGRYVLPGLAGASRRSAARQGWVGRLARRTRSHRRPGRARRPRKQAPMIKATIVLLVAHVVIPRLKRRSAAERHALWTAALTIATLLPLLTWLLPSWEPAWAQRAAESWPVFESRLDGGNAGDIVIRATGVDASDRTIAAFVPWLWIAGSLLLCAMFARQALRLHRLTASGVEAPAR